MVYSAYYVTRSLYGAYAGHHPETPVNPIIATLTMVSMRIHYTLDNTYTTVAALLIATRLMNKIARFTRATAATWSLRRSVSMAVDILADSVLIALLIYAGIVPHHSREPIITGLYIVQVSL